MSHIGTPRSGIHNEDLRTPQSEIGDGRAWYVAKTKPRREEQTAIVLAQRGLEIYLPRLAVWTMGRGTRDQGLGARGGGLATRGRRTLPQPPAPSPQPPPRLEPLFPGYLFARMDADSPEWVMARSAPGVAYFLGAEGRPTPVPAELVEGIQRRAEAQQKQGYVHTFRTGDRVVITSGPLAGLEAVFDGTLSPSGRSRIFVQVLSRLVPVEIAVELLRRAS